MPSQSRTEETTPFLHDEFFDASQILRALASDMSVLARSFSDTGNAAVSDRLWDWADAADATANKINAAATRMVEERLHESQQATSNMLGLAFALLTPRAALTPTPEK